MRFKFYIVILFYSFGLVASDEGPPWSVDEQLLSMHDRTVAHLKEQELIRKSTLLECSQRLSESNVERVEFKVARDLLEIYWKDMKQSQGIRQELDKITKKHGRKAPFFFGYVSEKELKNEVLDLNRIVKKSLAEDSEGFTPAVMPTAPMEPIIARVVGSSNSDK